MEYYTLWLKTNPGETLIDSLRLVNFFDDESKLERVIARMRQRGLTPVLHRVNRGGGYNVVPLNHTGTLAPAERLYEA